MDGSHGYHQGGGSGDGHADQDASVNQQSSWPLQGQEYDFPSTQSFVQPAFSPPQSSPQQRPYTYGSYPVPGYHDGQHVRYPQEIGPYNNSALDAIQAQGRAAQQPMQFTQETNPYYQTQYEPEGQTISPQVLQRSNHRSSQPAQNHLTGFESDYHAPADADSDTGLGYGQPYGGTESSQQQSSTGDVVGFRQGLAPVNEPAKPSKSSLRVTHPKLLRATADMPSRRLPDFPMVLFDASPMRIELSARVKLALKKPVRGPSERPAPGAVGNLNAAPSLAAIPGRNIRAPPLKPTASNTEAGSLIDQVNFLSRNILPQPGFEFEPLAPSPYHASTSSKDDSNSGEESDEWMGEASTEMASEQLSDVRSDARPADEVAAAAWDATGIVFMPRHRRVTLSEIGEVQQEYMKFLVGLRDGLKKSMDDVVAAGSAKAHPDQVKTLRAARALKRDVMSSAVRATIANGHHELKALFGKNEKLVVALLSVLRLCYNARDFSSDLPSTVFELIAQFDHMTDDLLQRVKYEPLERKFLGSKETTPAIKEFINQIRSKVTASAEREKQQDRTAVEASKEKLQESKRQQDRTPVEASKEKLQEKQESLKSAKVDGLPKSRASSIGVKRTLDEGSSSSSSSQPTKKATSEASASGPNQKVSATKPRSTTIFNALTRQPTKPQIPAKASNSGTPTPTKKPETKPEPKPTPKPLLAELLASIENPREPPKPPGPPPGPPETPEEKAKRERKESRRHLRVKFKDTGSLLEIKIFEREERDEGQMGYMLKDAHDDRSEGAMLKQRLDDDDGPGEIEFSPYSELTPIDFSDLSAVRANINYVTRGGRLPVSSTQEVVQNRRESTELMVVYARRIDIPRSPKEPPRENRENREPYQVKHETLNAPKAPWVRQRAIDFMQDAHRYGKEQAYRRLYHRINEGLRDHGNDRQRNRAALPPAHVLESILNTMKNAPGQHTAANNLAYRQPPPTPAASSLQLPMAERGPPMDPADFASLLATVNSLKGKPFPATEPPDWMNAMQRAEWLEGYNRDKAASDKKKAEARSAVGEPALGLGAPATALPSAAVAAQLASMMAILRRPDVKTLTDSLLKPELSLPRPQQSWTGTWPATTAATTLGQPARWDAASGSASYSETSRAGFETTTSEANRSRDRESSYGTTEDRFRNNNPSDYKRNTKPCKFWQEGKCAKGANCTFRHD